MKATVGKTFVCLAITLFLLCSCSLVELSGTLTRTTGEVLSDYSKKDKSVIGKMAGFGGRVNTAVGSTVEDMGKKGAAGESGESVGSAGGKVFTSGYNAAFGNETSSSSKSGSKKSAAGDDTVAKAQNRLRELGYDVAVDGVWGKNTRKAVGKFQAKEGLPVTKRLDKATLSALGISGS